MQRQYLRALGAVALALPALTAAAEKGVPRAYFGGSYLDFDYAERHTPDDKYVPSGVMLRVGRRFNEHLGVDFQAGSSQTVDDFRVARFTGLLLRLGVPWERLQLYTQLGPAQTELELDGTTEVHDGVAYGFGVRIDPPGDFDFVVEWMDYTVTTEERLSVIGIGLTHDFGGD